MPRKRTAGLSERVQQIMNADPDAGKPCTKKHICAFLQAALGFSENKRPGLLRDRPLDLNTGKFLNPMLVYYTSRNEYIECVRCPFCGGKVK